MRWGARRRWKQRTWCADPWTEQLKEEVKQEKDENKDKGEKDEEDEDNKEDEEKGDEEDEAVEEEDATTMEMKKKTNISKTIKKKKLKKTVKKRQILYWQLMYNCKTHSYCTSELSAPHEPTADDKVEEDEND